MSNRNMLTSHNYLLKTAYCMVHISSPWQKFKNVSRFIRALMGGDRFEWQIDFESATRPVLLIHGFAMPRQCMAILENRLTADGFDVLAFRLGPANFLGVERASRLIGLKLRQLSANQGMHRIAIVGHSLGGIIGRAYVSLRKGNRFCHTLITLGSPHQGHPAGAWKRSKLINWFTDAPRDLAPESETMKRLRENPIPQDVYSVSIFSDGDHICPASLCKMDIPQGSTHMINIPLDGMNHTDFMVDSHAYDTIKTHLDEGFRRADAAEHDPDETLPITD